MMRVWLPALFALALAGCATAGLETTIGDEGLPPAAGPAAPTLERFDGLMSRILEQTEAPGAELALVKDGRLVFARGYGHADVGAERPMRPDTPIALANISKTITALTVLRLCDEGKLSLDESAFARIKIVPAGGAPADPRLAAITVRELLQHTAGWDTAKSGDPLRFRRRVSRTLRAEPISAERLIRYMMGRKLDFDPGTRAVYSNFGYVVLGRLIEEATGLPYEEAVRRTTLKPLGAARLRLAPAPPDYLPGEARRYGPRSEKQLHGGLVPAAAAAGGWVGSAVDVARLLAALDGPGASFLSAAMRREMLAAPPAPAGARKRAAAFGLGWDRAAEDESGATYAKEGALPGVQAWVERLKGGVTVIALFNGHGDGKFDPRGRAMSEIPAAVLATEDWPQTDLFPRFE
ncbi:MAG TPA: serine hydrolase domain-containing protein [Acidobacteriota bacterium]|nr:serine hydrolase domain-containing protein [Acidobacteriota bacterium]